MPRKPGKNGPLLASPADAYRGFNSLGRYREVEERMRVITEEARRDHEERERTREEKAAGESAALQGILESILHADRGTPPASTEPPIEPVTQAPAVTRRTFVDDAHRRHVKLLDSVIGEIKLESFLAEHPTLKKTSVTDYKAGRIKGRVSPEKRAAIEAAISASAKVHLPNSD